MVNALLLHPYNFRDLDSLVRVWENRGIDEGFDARFIAPADAEDLRSAAQSFLSFTTYQFSEFNLSTEGNVESVLGCRVSANFFDILGVTPASGRLFSSAEEQPGADGVAIVGRGLWQRRFAGDPNLIGKTISLNGRAYSVVGIMPKDFSFPVPAELWVPLTLAPAEKSDRAQLTLNALARLNPGTNVQEARAALASFSQQLSRDFPKTNSGRVTTLLPLRKELYLYTLPLFLLLQAAAVVVLLLACANLANLVFARMIGRQREIAVRSALGAGRGRLAQHFISETLVLSGVAGLVAIVASLMCGRSGPVFRSAGQNGFPAGTASRWIAASSRSHFSWLWSSESSSGW
jgi:putative ABC transport system permease protein